MNNTFKNFLTTFQVNKQMNTTGNVKPDHHKHQHQHYNENNSDLQKTFYQNTQNKFIQNQTNRSFNTTIFNKTNNSNILNTEPNLSDVKNLLSCFLDKSFLTT